MKYILLIVTLALIIDSLPQKVLAKTNNFQLDSLEIQEDKTEYNKELKRFSRILVDNSFFDNIDFNNLNRKFKKDIQEDYFYDSRQLKITTVYPNPADIVAFMDYDMLESISSKVTIRNLLGKVIREYRLDKDSHKIRIPTTNFDPGVYFYTLKINNRNVKSRKLLVKHQ